MLINGRRSGSNGMNRVGGQTGASRQYARPRSHGGFAQRGPSSASGLTRSGRTHSKPLEADSKAIWAGGRILVIGCEETPAPLGWEPL
jgi:hypothetical protein